MIDINEQIKCVEREIKMRERVYPRWIEQGRMSQTKADHELEAMKAVKQTLMNQVENEEFELV